MANILTRDGKFLAATGTGDNDDPHIQQVALGAGGDPGGGAVAVAGSATVTGVTSSASTGQLLAANSDRTGVLIHNNSTATLYLKYGATASIASGGYSVPMEPGSYWEMPQPVYRGQIDGIWSAANGYANVTEVE